MPYCIFCSSKVSDEVKDCPNCGLLLRYENNRFLNDSGAPDHSIAIPERGSFQESLDEVLEEVSNFKENIDGFLFSKAQSIERDIGLQDSSDVFYLDPDISADKLIARSLILLEQNIDEKANIADLNNLGSKLAKNKRRLDLANKSEYLGKYVITDYTNKDRSDGDYIVIERISRDYLEEFGEENIPPILYSLVFRDSGRITSAVLAHENTHSFLHHNFDLNSKYQEAINEGAAFCSDYFHGQSLSSSFDSYRDSDVPKSMIESSLHAFVKYVDESLNHPEGMSEYYKMKIVRERALYALRELSESNSKSIADAILDGNSKDMEILEKALIRLERAEFYSSLVLFQLGILDSEYLEDWQKTVSDYQLNNQKSPKIKPGFLNQEVSELERAITQVEDLTDEKVQNEKGFFSINSNKDGNYWKELEELFKELVDEYKVAEAQINSEYSNHSSAEIGKKDQHPITTSRKIDRLQSEIVSGDSRENISLEEEKKRVLTLLKRRLSLIETAIKYVSPMKEVLSNMRNNPRFEDMLEILPNNLSAITSKDLEKSIKFLDKSITNLERARKNAREGIELINNTK